LLLTHSSENSNKEIFALFKVRLDLLAQVTVWELDVVLGDTILGHEIEETIVNVNKLVFSAVDIGDIHVVGGGADIFHFLAGEDVDGDQVDLGVTVLAGLGGAHVDDLARPAFDDDVAVLPQGRALHREGEGGPRRSLVEVGLVVLLIVRHFGGEGGESEGGGGGGMDRWR